MEEQYIEVVCPLLEADADVKSLAGIIWSPLHLGTFYYSILSEDHLEIIRLLLNRAGNPNLRNIDSETPSHMAATQGDADVLEELLRNGADIRALNFKGNNALGRAAFA